jgi:hypothetical protein
MADVQQQFEQFHTNIRVDYEMSKTLREKRDIVVETIKKHMKENDRPIPSQLLQGSYKMKTGVKPIADIEFDIDIGLRFSIHEGDNKATEIREWVLEAIGDHTNRVESKGPCIRVCYEAGYHLDIVCYAVWEDDSELYQYRLAHKTNGWRHSDPPKLIEYVNDARRPFESLTDSATQTDQFRRCIRYLRRWADELRPVDGDSCKPSGIGIVILSVFYRLTPSKFLDERPDDRTALDSLTYTLSQTVGRLHANKTTPEYEDILSSFSDDEMEQLKAEYLDLYNALNFAGTTADPIEACKRLQSVFGKDFPIPEPDDIAKKSVAPAIIPSSSSA